MRAVQLGAVDGVPRLGALGSLGKLAAGDGNGFLAAENSSASGDRLDASAGDGDGFIVVRRTVLTASDSGRLTAACGRDVTACDGDTVFGILAGSDTGTAAIARCR